MDLAEEETVTGVNAHSGIGFEQETVVRDGNFLFRAGAFYLHGTESYWDRVRRVLRDWFFRAT